ncbi:hypothetical protein BDZ94DRAFT_1326870 [Collybia nuda]|uniref:FAD-binding PCMH-type domain-containing protein n=1 Tax=Collybia nuda TaxID=64659 RepID=A0A9P6CC01_9AGAR|nr:hypothetical protein BDZ94DRAFT_1326870 [Collybia nuda]
MTNIYDLGIQGSVLTPSSSTYNDAIARHSLTSVLHPSYVIYPITIPDIQVAIQFALSNDPPLEIAVKGGGCHTSTASSSEGGLVIDLSRFNKVVLSADRASVVVQGGALWGDVYSTLAEHNLVAVGASVWFVGVGGYLTGGGYSSLSGKYGMAIDNLLQATVVLADGRNVQCGGDEEPDLFWAIRGGTNQFGVVAEFVLKTHPYRPALVGALVYPGTDLPKILDLTREYLKTQLENSNLSIMFTRSAPHFQPGIVALPYIENDDGEAEKRVAPFRTTITPVFERIGTAPNYNVFAHGADATLADIPPRSVAGGALFSEAWDDVISTAFREWVTFTEKEEHKRSMMMWEFNPRNKIAEVAEKDTAFPTRNPHYHVVITASHSLPESDAPAREWVSKMATYIKSMNTERTGVKFVTPTNFSLGSDYDSVEEVFGKNLSRLRKVKAIYDPKKVWRKGWAIEPDPQ